jgi:hypothetical protein
VFASDSDLRIRPEVQDELLEKGIWKGLLGDAAHSRVLSAHPEILNYRTTLSRAPDKPATGSFDLRSKDITAEAPRLEAEIATLRNRRPIGKAPNTLESVVVHESNHPIQDLLRMDTGSSPDRVLQQYRDELRQKLRLGLIRDEDKGFAELGKLPTGQAAFDKLPPGPLKEELYRRYLDSFGEENARLSQKLMGLTDKEIAKNALLLPSWYDTPVAGQIASPKLQGLLTPLLDFRPPVK